MHLASQKVHAEGCTERSCAARCDWRRFHDWLAEPLLAADERADERIRQRREALIRGEIPA